MKITFLLGVTFGQWLKVLMNKNIKFSFRHLINHLLITIISLINQTLLVPERIFFHIKRNQKVQDPIFIIGLWRSGTTLLHFLLSKDKTFCAPSNFQCVFPHTFNVMEKLFPLKLDRVVIPRPQDNMVIKLDSPCEDEVALCSLVPDCAFYNYFFFSQNKEYFFEYLDFEECSHSVVNLWLKHHKKFHKKVSHYYNYKRVVYKSPAHTARIKHLIKIYPNASFVHITRHPLDIIQSSIHSIETLSEIMFPLQELNIGNLQDTTFMIYKNVLNKLNEDLSLLQPDQYCRIKYEDILMDPLKKLSEVYDKLGLSTFDKSRNELLKYLASIEGYKKNRYEPYSPSLKTRILSEFEPFIKKWEYDSNGSRRD